MSMSFKLIQTPIQNINQKCENNLIINSLEAGVVQGEQR